MSYPASISSERRTRGRRALGLFAAVWLNLALAPCAMAYESQDDHDCPHCPPAEEHGHHDMHAGMQAEMPCADGMSDCSLDGDFSHDVRNGKAKLKDTQHELPAFVAADEPPPQPVVRHHQRAPPWFATAHAGASPPLHVLYCVYLD